MNRMILLLTLLALPMASSWAFNPPVKGLQQVISLVIQSKSGNNGVAVAYHPKKKLYYAAYAGNEQYPIEVFKKDGQPLHTETIKFDARGLWYNPKTKRLEGNSYAASGIFSFTVDSEGVPGIREQEPFGQPEDQSAGVYNAKTGEVIFYENESKRFVFYSRERGREVRRLEVAERETRFYNMRLGFTGIKGKELALLVPETKEIVLFSMKTGEEVEVLRLPSSATVEPAFNFDCSNGIYWVYDKERKIWQGYQ